MADLLYRLVPHNGGAVFAETDRAEFVARIHRALSKSKNWGEFKTAMPEREYERIMHDFDEEGEPRPTASDEFKSDYIGGYSDGDYPPWLQSEMDMVIPEEILWEFGERQTTFVNGDFWHIPEQNMENAAEALRECGYEVERADELPFH